MSVTVDAPTRGPWPWLARLFGRGRTDAEMYTMVGPVASGELDAQDLLRKMAHMEARLAGVDRQVQQAKAAALAQRAKGNTGAAAVYSMQYLQYQAMLTARTKQLAAFQKNVFMMGQMEANEEFGAALRSMVQQFDAKARKARGLAPVMTVAEAEKLVGEFDQLVTDVEAVAEQLATEAGGDGSELMTDQQALAALDALVAEQAAAVTRPPVKNGILDASSPAKPKTQKMQKSVAPPALKDLLAESLLTPDDADADPDAVFS